MDWFRALTQTHTLSFEDQSSPDTEPDPEPEPKTHSWFSWFSSFSSFSFSFSNIDIDIQTVLLELLFAYNKFCIQLTQRIQTMNANYAAARYISFWVHSLSMFCGFALRFFFFPETNRQFQEPDESWVNIVCLYRTPKHKTIPTHEHFLDTNAIIDTPDAHYYIEETYRNYDHEDLGDELEDPTYINPMEMAEMYYSQACIAARRLYKQDLEIDEIVVWSRDTHRDEQIVNVCSSNCSSFPIIKQDVVYSSVVFLNIEYRHPRMGDIGIELTIPKQLMIVGNELFSPAFLYRWLKYFSSVPFVFDNTYCVYLMDDNVNQHILRYGDYIVLGKTDIEVIRRNEKDAPIENENENESVSVSSSLPEEEEKEQENEEEQEQEEDNEYQHVSNRM